jgi:3-oxoacyl-[acyl-carrier protein] reductase
MKSAPAPFVIVTGAGQGVGRATALELANAHNCSVLAVSRNADALATLAVDPVAQGRVEVLALDLTAVNAGDKLKAAVGGRSIDALVLNHGQLLNKPFAQITRAELQELFTANVFSAIAVVQALLESLVSGHVVTIGSMGGFQDSIKYPGLSSYSASKAALACISQCLATEFTSTGPKVNCLCLGSVDTAMLRAAFPGYASPTTPATMGAFIARFALEGHRVFNGQVLPVALSNP